jgi:hypothetical protein
MAPATAVVAPAPPRRMLAGPAHAWSRYTLGMALALVPFVLLHDDNYWINILTVT